jgi:hypothetical protein
MSNIPPSERVETILPDRPKGLRGIGSLGRVIWAAARRGRHKEGPLTAAPNPMAAAFFKKSRRFDSVVLSPGDDMIHISSKVKRFRVQRSRLKNSQPAIIKGILFSPLL